MLDAGATNLNLGFHRSPAQVAAPSEDSSSESTMMKNIFALRMSVNERLNLSKDRTKIDMGTDPLAISGLGEALAENKTLVSLHLDGNKLGDTGAAVVAEALKKNATLTYLNMSDASIGDAGALALADALKQNSALKMLILNFNEFGDAGAAALAEALKANRTLENLDVIGNVIGTGAKAALKSAAAASAGRPKAVDVATGDCCCVVQ